MTWDSGIDGLSIDCYDEHFKKFVFGNRNCDQILSLKSILSTYDDVVSYDIRRPLIQHTPEVSESSAHPLD